MRIEMQVCFPDCMNSDRKKSSSNGIRSSRLPWQTHGSKWNQHSLRLISGVYPKPSYFLFLFQWRTISTYRIRWFKPFQATRWMKVRVSATASMAQLFEQRIQYYSVDLGMDSSMDMHIRFPALSIASTRHWRFAQMECFEFGRLSEVSLELSRLRTLRNTILQVDLLHVGLGSYWWRWRAR